MSTIGNLVTQTVTLGSVSTYPTYASPLTILSTGTVALSGTGNAVYGPGSSAWTVVNQGGVSVAGTTGIGIDLMLGGYVGNSGVISAPTGVAITGAVGTVTNSGTIQATGTSSYGVSLSSGGNVTNANTANPFVQLEAIQGSRGVYIGGAGGNTLVNAGTITGTGGTAVSLAGSGNRVIIGPGAVFTGSVNGGTGNDTLELAPRSFFGNGTLSGLGTKYVGFSNVTVDAGARWVLAGANTVAAGVTLSNAFSLTNSGTLTVGGIVTDAGKFQNTGSIAGTLTVTTGGYLLNVAPGTITGVTNGVTLTGASKVRNTGLITAGASGTAIALGQGESVLNAGYPFGVIEAGQYGVYAAFGAPGTVFNTGLIAATANTASSGGAIKMLSGGTVQNFGTVNGYGATAIYLKNSSGTVLNQGTILSSSSNGPGVFLQAGGTIVDSGTITSGNGTAISFGGTGSNRLVLYSSYVFGGKVVGGGSSGATNTLELTGGYAHATAVIAGTITGIGTEFIGFGAVVVDAYARWTLAGSNTLGSGASLTNQGTLVLSGALSGAGGVVEAGPGPLIVTGSESYTGGTTIEAGGIVQLGTGGAGGSITGNIIDGGVLIVDESGTVTLSNNISGSGGLLQEGPGTTRLAGSNSYSGVTRLAAGTLELVNPGAAGTSMIVFSASPGALLRIDGTTMPLNPIAGFARFDTIDLAGIAATRYTYTGGVLHLLAGLKQVAQLTLSTVFAKPTFALKSDSHGGTDITLASVVVSAAAGQPATPVGTGSTGASLLASPHDATWFIRSG
jgi:fibronectin-binding autotransporter adhesin